MDAKREGFCSGKFMCLFKWIFSHFHFSPVNIVSGEAFEHGGMFSMERTHRVNNSKRREIRRKVFFFLKNP